MEGLIALADEFHNWDALKPEHRHELMSSCCEDVKHEIIGIQSIQVETKTMMNMKRIQRFLTSMEHFEKVMIALNLTDTPRIMACVWGPMRYLLKVNG